ncbi:MAG: DNA translocase FtsK 4TM domain-containing protein, partial [Deltaproteobacteria bacterium]|nr:DNA translocase FtsK 4TM domain-containing protein [Deltaproteobacteria bacterium]
MLVAVVLGVSLFTHHPADVVIGVKTGDGVKPFNLFGSVGANLSGWIFYIFGFAAFWVIAIFLPMAVLSFTGKQTFSPFKTILATLFVVASFSGLLALEWPGFVNYRGEDVRMDGLVGHYLAGYMKLYLNEFGASVLLLAVFVISIIVCTRVSLGLVFKKIMLWVLALMKRLREYFLKRKEQRRKKKVRAKIVQKEKIRPKRQVTILEPEKKKKEKPAQEAFSFMNVAGKFKLPPLDLLNDPPEESAGQIQRESLEMNARRLEK